MAYPATPKTWVAGDVLTAAQLNAELRDALLAAFPLDVDAWTTWSPTLTNLTLGNGTLVAKYQRVGRTIFWRFRFLLGSTSAVATGPAFTLPVAAHAEYSDAAQETMGTAMFRDNAGVGYNGQVNMSNTAASRVTVSRIGGSGSGDVNVTATAPFTWGTGDYITASGFYEAAS